MNWIINLFTTTDSVAHIALLYAVVIAIGILLGKIKLGGISLGVTFVLFTGIVAGHIGFTAPVDILSFIQDFGLILFVFCIGLQVGPGFFESFKKGGVTLNLLSTSTVLLNVRATRTTVGAPRAARLTPTPVSYITSTKSVRQYSSCMERKHIHVTSERVPSDI